MASGPRVDLRTHQAGVDARAPAEVDASVIPLDGASDGEAERQTLDDGEVAVLENENG